jgi:CHAT domain-containing protein/tetratricopeptide (TPR) repeat protein
MPRTLIACSLAFALALAVAAVGLSIRRLHPPFPWQRRPAKVSALRADLVGALGAVRLTAGRLTGFDHAPVQRSRPLDCRACAAIAAAIKRQAERHPSAVTLADYGVVKLAAQSLPDTVELLEQAVARKPNNPVGANDLAVAYIAQAQAEERPHLLSQALEILVRTGDSTPEVRFNHALVLEMLQLRSAASQAWRRYLVGPPEPGWRQEASGRLAALETPTRVEGWQVERPRLETAILRRNPGAVVRGVDPFRQEVRSFAQEQLLPAWGRSHLRGDGAAAERFLRLARALGAALVTVNGERSVADAVSAIDQAGGSPRLAALARGHAAYAEGLAAYGELRVKAAKASLAEAGRGFAEGGSAAADWVDLWLSGVDYYDGRHASAIARLEALLAKPEIRRYPALLGRALWAKGLIELQHMEVGRSVPDLRAALRAYEAIGELENSGTVNYLLAENFDLLGDTEEAWRYRERALCTLQGYPGSIWHNDLLLETTKDLLKEGQIRAALAFEGEELVAARRRGIPPTLAEALLLKARLESQVGEMSQAAESLAEAGSFVTRISDPGIRERLRIESLVTSSQIVGSRDPAAVLASLAEAIAYFKTAGLGHQTAFCYLLRARARLALGDAVAAEGDLRAGIEAYEAARDSLDHPSLRASYLEQWQPLFDEMILLQAARRQQPEEARVFAERAKVNLLCRTGETAGSAQPASATADPFCRAAGRASLVEIQHALPARASLVEYALLPDRVLIWVIGRHSFTLVTHPVPAAEVERLVESLLSALRDGRSPEESRRAGAALFEHLVRPMAAQVEADGRLILVPDKILSSLPFAALYDEAKRSYLVEQQVLSIEPSASFYVAKRRGAAPPPERWRLLAVAPAESAEIESLGPLPNAELEVTETARLYPRHQMLTGAEATSRRFLAALPGADAVEFAGHAVTNRREPSLSRLVFSPDPAAASSAMLFARDLRQASLDHLRLVVLSACATAPGSRARGTGFAGMTQAFLEAGTPAVVATLWKVNDTAARHVVLEFHRRLLAGEDGASALRSAQLALLHDRAEFLRQPAGWAAFELIGALQEPEL